ncbi:unnamed protein product, partial [Phaeothamnion confervicola]
RNGNLFRTSQCRRSSNTAATSAIFLLAAWFSSGINKVFLRHQHRVDHRHLSTSKWDPNALQQSLWASPRWPTMMPRKWPASRRSSTPFGTPPTPRRAPRPHATSTRCPLSSPTPARAPTQPPSPPARTLRPSSRRSRCCDGPSTATRSGGARAPTPAATHATSTRRPVSSRTRSRGCWRWRRR